MCIGNRRVNALRPSGMRARFAFALSLAIGFHRFRQALAESGKVFDIVADTQRQIDRTMSLSWLLSLQGGFKGSLTGNDNMRFIARI
jgi:hypothetical protein